MRFVFACLVCLVGTVASPVFADDSAATQSATAIYVDHAGLLKLGWQLACQGSTFADRSTFEMIDLLHSLNFHHIELCPGQSLSPDHPDVKISPDLSESDVNALLAKLRSVHLDIVSFGPIDPGPTEAEARKVFELGKKLRIKNIVADPSDDSLEMLDRLANEYRINVVIANGTKPGRHWDPDALAASLSTRSARMGVCADIAHWQLSGLVPVQCVQKLKGRVLEIRLSDMDDQGREVALGAGRTDFSAVLRELRKQNFEGICALEYETGSGDDRLNDFVLSVNAFSQVVAEIAGAH
jgi:sugar phosphate isomerase/epimerase